MKASFAVGCGEASQIVVGADGSNVACGGQFYGSLFVRKGQAFKGGAAFEGVVDGQRACDTSDSAAGGRL